MGNVIRKPTDNYKMEFTTLVELFDVLAPIKHKYRIVGMYIKYLRSIKTEREQEVEVDGFKRFLLTNRNLHERVFDNSVLKVNRENIYLDSALSFLDRQQQNLFWERLIQTDAIMFPKGRPVVEQSVDSSNTLLDSDEAKRIMASDPLLSEVMNKVLQSDAMSAVTSGEQPMDVTSIMSDPKIMDLASSITNSLTSGNYNEDSLANTIDTISSLVGEDADPQISHVITFLKKSIRDIKAKRPVDVAGLMQLVSSMNMGGVDLGPLMAQMLGGRQ